MVGNVTLDEDGAHFRVEARSEQRREHISRLTAKGLWGDLEGERVKVNDTVESVSALRVDPLAYRAQVVAEVH